MKREILKHRRGDCWCCPGHDKFPNNKYNSRVSEHARARDKKIEHQTVRAIEKRNLKKELNQND